MSPARCEPLEPRRLLAGGALDLSFGDLGAVREDETSARLGVLPLADGRLLTYGRRRVIVRDADGQLVSPAAQTWSRKLPFTVTSALPASSPSHARLNRRSWHSRRRSGLACT